MLINFGSLMFFVVLLMASAKSRLPGLTFVLVQVYGLVLAIAMKFLPYGRWLLLWKETLYVFLIVYGLMQRARLKRRKIFEWSAVDRIAVVTVIYYYFVQFVINVETVTIVNLWFFRRMLMPYFIMVAWRYFYPHDEERMASSFQRSIVVYTIALLLFSAADALTGHRIWFWAGYGRVFTEVMRLGGTRRALVDFTGSYQFLGYICNYLFCFFLVREEYSRKKTTFLFLFFVVLLTILSRARASYAGLAVTVILYAVCKMRFRLATKRLPVARLYAGLAGLTLLFTALLMTDAVDHLKRAYSEMFGELRYHSSHYVGLVDLAEELLHRPRALGQGFVHADFTQRTVGMSEEIQGGETILHDIYSFYGWIGLLLYFVFHGLLLKKLAAALRFAQSSKNSLYQEWALIQLLYVPSIMFVSWVSFSAGVVPSILFPTYAASAVVLSWHDRNKSRADVQEDATQTG
ncbi:MAG: hypothetical protein JXR37_14455 [Kiritimatiellae bacterium]|nr:hypothetical protein [Kiritimatiellia bacterium]